MNEGRTISFTLGGLAFEYDEQKNQINIKKHGISFKSAARIFFDYDRIELCDDEHSEGEIRYDTIGDTSSGNLVLVGEVTADCVECCFNKTHDVLLSNFGLQFTYVYILSQNL